MWHFQIVHHDLWDYDTPAAPILVDITVDGRKIKALAQITKQACAYVLDRVTGQPVWPIVEQPVPHLERSRREGVADAADSVEAARVRAPGNYRRRSDRFHARVTRRSARDLQALSHRSRVYATIDRGHRPGQVKGTIELPGSVGGADWTGAAFDPDTGVLYVPSMTNPFVADLIPGDPKETNLRYRASTRVIQGPRGLPLVKPPYGRITALDLNHGEQKWKVPNGDGPRLHPMKALNLPSLGQSVRAAPLVTKTLLFVSEGSDAMVNAARVPPGMPLEEAPKYGEPWFRAYDKATGTGSRRDRAARRHDERADDVSARRQAIHRCGRRRAQRNSGMGGAQRAVSITPRIPSIDRPQRQAAPPGTRRRGASRQNDLDRRRPRANDRTAHARPADR